MAGGADGEVDRAGGVRGGDAADRLRGRREARVLEGHPDGHAGRDELVHGGAGGRVERLGLGDGPGERPVAGGVDVDFHLMAAGARVVDRGVGARGGDRLETVVLVERHLDRGGDLRVGGGAAGAEAAQPRGGLRPQVVGIVRDEALVTQDALRHGRDVAVAEVELLGVEAGVAERDPAIEDRQPEPEVLALAALVGELLEEQVIGGTLRDEVVGEVVGEAEAADRLGEHAAESGPALDTPEGEAAERAGHERIGLRAALGHAPRADPAAGRGEIVFAQVRRHERERRVAVIHLVLA